MADAAGRYWPPVQVTTVSQDKRGKALQWTWGSSTALAALGAEGWELSAVVPGSGFPAGGVEVTFPTGGSASRDLLIFKQPLP